MAPSTHTTRFRFWLWLIRFVGLIVPRRLRADWRQEWEAELRYREALLAEWDKLNWQTKLDLLRRSLGAFRDALLLQPRRMEDEMFQDLRYGARMLVKQPGFTLIAVLTLALGIGANTAIFSIVNAVLLRPLPYPEAERLVTLVGQVGPFGRQSPLTPAEYVELRAQNKSFAEVAVYTGAPLNLTGGNEPVLVRGLTASAGLFRVLGVAPLMGRVFSEAENQPGSAQVVVLSYELWRSRFNADADIVGKAIKLDGESCNVIGVMPAGFRFPQPAEVITPVVIDPGARGNAFLRVIGRLRPEVTAAQAQAELEVIAARLHAANPQRERMDSTLAPLGEIVVENSRKALLVLLAAVACVLLIACVNLANLLLARAATRQKEFAVRAALGASRWRMWRQLLTESLLLALLGGAGGLLLASWCIKALPLIAPESLPRLNAINLDARVLGFTLCVALLTGVLFGLAPAWQATRLNLTAALKDGGPTVGVGGRGFRLGHLLVIGEVALSLVLLIGAGLLLNSLARLLRVERGFAAERVLTVNVPLPAAYRTVEQIVNFHDRALERLRAVPGVAAASTVNLLTLGGMLLGGDFDIEGRPPLPDDARRDAFVIKPAISADYFRALGIPLKRGREFNARDTANAKGVVIISESLARRFFVGEEALGKRISFDQDANRQPLWLAIVGVAGDVKQESLSAPVQPTVYAPYAQTRRAGMLRDVSFVLRTQLEPTALASAVQQEIRAVDGELPIARLSTMQQLVTESVTGERFNALLFGTFAALALALASVGMYGVMAYFVAARTREIGVRMALGAQVGAVIRMVIGQGMKLALSGVALGIGGALALTRWLKSMLFDVSATDPLTFGLVACLLLAVALVACWIPARRVAKVDPLMALRHD